MITYLYANNYKSLVNIKIDFQKLNILLGANGTGKSNALLLIGNLCAFIRGGEGSRTYNVFPMNTLTRWMDSNVQTFELGVDGFGHEYKYFLEIEHDTEHYTCQVLSEEVYCDGMVLFSTTNGVTKLYTDDSKGEKSAFIDFTTSGINLVLNDAEHKKIAQFKAAVNQIIYCSINPKVMYDQVENDVYGPKYDFSNIGSAFAGIQQLYPDVYLDLKRAMQEINPSFDRVRIAVDKFPKYLAIDYMYNDVSVAFRFNELSDGEKMLFALYLLLFGLVKNGMTVLLDEPDNYLSLREIQPWCMELESIIENNGQCLLISHHPEIIDYYADTYGIWFDRRKSGESSIVDNPYYNQEDAKILPYSELIARGDVE